MKQTLPKVLFIAGPTASGKTALAKRLADFFAHRGGAEIISADSRQVYCGMDIGTGKEYLPGVRQHLLDIKKPNETWTLFEFLGRAKKCIAEINARGALPMVVGGSGLYVQALAENWDLPPVAPDRDLREKLEQKNPAELNDELKKIDPHEAARLKLGKRYLVRALEMWYATGRAPSLLKIKQSPHYDALVLGIDCPRSALYARIDRRVADMCMRGLAGEVRGLLRQYGPDAPGLNAIGYREFRRFEQPWSGEALAKIQSAIAHHSHAFARRQMTYLRRMPQVCWITDYDGAMRLLQPWLSREQ